MTNQPCEECDFVGPELPTMYAAARDFHRAAHDLGRALLLTPVAQMLMRWLSAVERIGA